MCDFTKILVAWSTTTTEKVIAAIKNQNGRREPPPAKSFPPVCLSVPSTCPRRGLGRGFTVDPSCIFDHSHFFLSGGMKFSCSTSLIGKGLGVRFRPQHRATSRIQPRIPAVIEVLPASRT